MQPFRTLSQTTRFQPYPCNNALGKRVVLGEEESREMLGALGFCARQLDLRAIGKFGLETIEPKFKEPSTVAASDGGA